MTTITPEPILQVASGFMAAKYLFVASEIGLFEQLAHSPATLDTLAERTGIARPQIRILADALMVLGLIERQGQEYQNRPAAAAFLSGAERDGMRPLLRFWDQLSYPMWTRLGEAVRTSRGQGTMALSGEQERIFLEGVEAIMAMPAVALPEVYDFGHHRRVLDLGGGTGSWLSALLQHYPHLQATLYDLPNATAIAEQRFATTSGGQRAEVVAGDFYHDPIPDSHDAVLIANVFHLFSPAHNLELLRRTRARVPNGARLLLADFWTDTAHTQPNFAAMMAGEFFVITGEGDVYSEEEVCGWLRASGWQFVDHRPLAGALSLLVAETAAN